MAKIARFKSETITRQLTVEEAVSEAFGGITSLGESMREAFDNTPESLQQSAAGEAREAAADALEGISEIEVPEKLRELTLKFSTRTVPPRKQTRSWEREEASSLLSATVERLEADDLKNNEEAEELARELQDALDELDSVEFPGMYG